MMARDISLERIAAGSIAVGLVVLLVKYLAYTLTDSVALYSDSMESIVNVAASIAAFVAVRIGGKPADDDHPYGHHKVEYFAAVFVGVMIVLTALSIAFSAYEASRTPTVIASPTGLFVNAAAGALNGVWCIVLFRAGRNSGSPALLADARHLLSDVISSLGVLIGVLLAYLTGWWQLDIILALLVAVNILWSGYRLLVSSLGALMDKAVDPQTRERLETIIAANGAGAMQAHDIRSRRSGQATFIEFHLVVPADMRVGEAHDICDRLERAIEKNIKGSQVTVHVEPETKAKEHGVSVT